MYSEGYETLLKRKKRSKRWTCTKKKINGDHTEIKSLMPSLLRHLIKNISVVMKVTDLEITSDDR